MGEFHPAGVVVGDSKSLIRHLCSWLQRQKEAYYYQEGFNHPRTICLLLPGDGRPGNIMEVFMALHMDKVIVS